MQVTVPAACYEARREHWHVPMNQAGSEHLTSISPLVAEGRTGPGTEVAVAEAGPPPGTWPSTVPAALPASSTRK